MCIKKSFLFIICVFIINTIVAQKPVSIQGILTNNTGYQTISLQLAYGAKTEYAKAIINTDGRFDMKAVLPTTDIYALVLEANNVLNLALSPGDNVTFTANAAQIMQMTQASGSPSMLYTKRNFDRYKRTQTLVDSLNSVLSTDPKQIYFSEFINKFNTYHQTNQDGDRYMDSALAYADSLITFSNRILEKGAITSKNMTEYLYQGAGYARLLQHAFDPFENYRKNINDAYNFSANRLDKEQAFYALIDAYQTELNKRHADAEKALLPTVEQLTTWLEKFDAQAFAVETTKKMKTEWAQELSTIVKQITANMPQTLAAYNESAKENNQKVGEILNYANSYLALRYNEVQNFFNVTNEKNLQTIQEDLLQNKDNLSTLLFIDIFPRDQYAALHGEMADALYTKYPENALVKSKYEFEHSVGNATSIGAMAPDLTFSNPDGKILKLSDLRGKVVLLDFWASWCRPCRMENPNVVAAYQKYHAKGFEVYSVSLDREKNSWVKAIADDKLEWQYHVSDLKFWSSEAARIYGVTSIPHTFLLDKTGRIAAKNLHGEELSKAIERLLNDR